MAEQPGSTAYRIREILREGPSTTGEIAAELGIMPRLAGAHLHNQFERGHLSRAHVTMEKRMRCLWSIAE